MVSLQKLFQIMWIGNQTNLIGCQDSYVLQLEAKRMGAVLTKKMNTYEDGNSNM